MSTLENNTSVVSEEKNILKEVVEKNTKIENDVDKDEPETKKQRLSDLHDDTKDGEDTGKAENGDEIEDAEQKEDDEEPEEKEDDEDDVESSESKAKEEILSKEKDCNGSSGGIKVKENGDSAESEINA